MFKPLQDHEEATNSHTPGSSPVRYNLNMNTASSAQAIKFLEPWLAHRATQSNMPGFSISIAFNREVSFSRAYGLADSTMEIPMTPAHLFCVASQSKMITATAILQLVQENALSLDDPVAHYVPWLEQHHDRRFMEITTRQLLTHQAGIIRDGERADYWQHQAGFPNHESLRQQVYSTSLIYDPGQKLKYSNLGFAIAGQVIESASRKSYSEYVNERIIAPLALDAMFPDWNEALFAKTAIGYSRPQNQKRTAIIPGRQMRSLAPAAGAWASTTNLCQFAVSHFYGNDILLLDETKKRAHCRQIIVPTGYDRGYEYGLGFEIISVAGRRLVGHSGSHLGYRSATFLDPDSGLAVSVASNAKDSPALAMVRGVFGALYHFKDTAARPAPSSVSRFNAHLHSGLGDTSIIATHDAIVALDPNDWQPFSWHESLSSTDRDKLRVTTSNSIHAEGEKVSYVFNKHLLKSVRYAGLTLHPRQDCPQEAADQAYTLPREPAEALFLHYLEQNDGNYFRLELLPEYDVDIEEASSSLRAWLKGNTRQAVALLEQDLEILMKDQPWLKTRHQSRKPNCRNIRVRVINDEFTPYMQWEREHFNRINIPIGGETIIYLPQKALDRLALPAGDVILLGSHAIVNRYQASTLTHRTFYSTSHPDIKRFTDLKQKVLQIAMRHRVNPNI
jgi:D-alanyl-D-alanine carboxypeptidase